MSKNKVNLNKWDAWAGRAATSKPTDVMQDQAADDVEREYDEGTPDYVLRRRKEARAQEAASWAAGGNLIDEGGVLCDLDRCDDAELRDKLSYDQYAENYRDGKPRARLLAVLKRKLDEQIASNEESASDNPNASAKEYVLTRLKGVANIGAAYNVGIFSKEHLFEALSRMNRDVAVIKVGNAVKYMVLGIDAEGRSEFRFLSDRHFHQLYSNVLVPGEAVEDCGIGKGKTGGSRLSHVWDAWRDRRELEGIGFYPGSAKHPANPPCGYLNMWSGLAIEPKKGDWSLFRKHLLDKVCSGDAMNWEFLLDWLAHAVQQPQRKPGCAIVLKSKQKGSGKSMLLKFLRPIFGRHLYSAAKIDQLTGRFNGHLEETIIFGVEEGFWAGSHQANSALKDLITGEHIAVERKGLDSRNVPNFTRFIFLSNESWVIPVGTSERRYFVLEFEHDRAQDGKYFDPIFEQMEHNGGVAAMLHDLMERKITADLRNPPTTAGLLKQREQTFDGAERFLLELAREGEIVTQASDQQLRLKDSLPTTVGKSVVWEVAKQFFERHKELSLQTSLGAKLAEVGVTTTEVRHSTHRRSFVFPKLSVFREKVSKLLSVPIEAVGVVADDEENWQGDQQRAPIFDFAQQKSKRSGAGTRRHT